MESSIIDQYEQGGAMLRQAVSGLSREHLLATPVPGTWSIQQIVLHLMDADLIWTARMKQIVAEDNPSIAPYDESKFAANLTPEAQSAEEAVTIFDLNRRQFARVLRRLPESAWARTGRHAERGTITLAQSLTWTTEHVPHHLAFLQTKRQLLGR